VQKKDLLQLPKKFLNAWPLDKKIGLFVLLERMLDHLDLILYLFYL